MKMELTGYGIIMLITLSEYILYPAAHRLYCASVEPVPWTEHLRKKYLNTAYWKKKMCQGHNADRKIAHDDVKDGLSRSRMLKNGSDFVLLTYTTINSRAIELSKLDMWVDDEAVIFLADRKVKVATIVKDNNNLRRPGAILDTMNDCKILLEILKEMIPSSGIPLITYCVIDDQPDYRITMIWSRAYAMVEITDDLMNRYVNTSTNPLQKYERDIAKVLFQHKFNGTCTNIVPNKFPFDFWIGDIDYFRNNQS